MNAPSEFSKPFLLSGTLGLFGKDLKQFARIPLGTLVLLVLLVLLNAIDLMLNPEKPFEPSWASDLMRGFLFVTSYAIGLAITVEEEEEETSGFLLQLPIHPITIILQKFLASLVLLAGWIVCAGAFLILSKTGTLDHVLYGIKYESLGGTTIWHGLLLSLTLMTLGASVGSWFGQRGLPFAALMGFSLIGLLIVCFHYYHFRFTEAVPPEYFYQYVFGLTNRTSTNLTGLMAILFFLSGTCWYLREHTRQIVPPSFVIGLFERVGEEEKDQFFDATAVRFPALNRRLILFPAIFVTLSASGILVLSSLIFGLQGSDLLTYGVMISVGFTCPLLGCLSCAKGEREQAFSLIHQLPVSFSKVQTQRLIMLAGSTMISMILFFGGILFYFHQTLYELPTKELYTVILIIPALVGFAWSGHLLRLLSKSILVSIVISAFFQIPLYFICYGVILTCEDYIGIAWVLFIFWALPFMMIKFITNYTTVLEWSEGNRFSMGLGMMTWLFIWTTFLITMNPVDLWIMLTY